MSGDGGVQLCTKRGVAAHCVIVFIARRLAVASHAGKDTCAACNTHTKSVTFPSDATLQALIDALKTEATL